MLTEELKNKLSEIAKGTILFDEPMSNHTTIKVGGVVNAFVEPTGEEDLLQVLKFAKEAGVDVYIVGAGSNVLFRDNGFDGIVVTTPGFKEMTVKEKTDSSVTVVIESGVMVSDIVNFSIQESLKGFAPLAGIPGTVGGALYMNAGTHDGNISDTLVKVNAIDKSGRRYEWGKDKLKISYRKIKFPKSCVVLSAEFQLEKGEKSEIEAQVNELRQRRKDRHPLQHPSMGSIFKNPEKGPSAGELIEEAGLKGVRVGGARVSEKHANWIINEGNATAKDIEVLIHLVREKVKEASDEVLDCEIITVGKKS